jgi:26S proteasome regulatory subunit N2
MAAVVGVAVWLQYWYWFPLLHFLSLAVTPTAVVGLTGDMKVAGAFELQCNSKPSWFAYPPPLEEKKDEGKGKVTTVELSTAAKAKAKAKAKAQAQAKPAGGAGAAAMDIDEGAGSAAAPAGGSESKAAEGGAPALPAASTAMDIDSGAGGPGEAATAAAGPGAAAAAAGEKKAEAEPSSFKLANPARVTPAQAKFISVPDGQRYVPVRKVRCRAIRRAVCTLRAFVFSCGNCTASACVL